MFITISDIGSVELKKSARAKRIILKINQEGLPVVTIPQLVSYKVAEKFVYEHQDWLKKNLVERQPLILTPGKAIGRKHSLQFKIALNADAMPKATVKNGVILVTHPSDCDFMDEPVQKEAKKAAIRALRKEAEEYLPSLLHNLATKFNYSYKEVRIKAVQTRWGSCSSNRVINLSVWLMQLPDHLIDYVICHELAHLSHMNHSSLFWDEVSKMIPDYKLRKKELKNYAPRLI